MPRLFALVPGEQTTDIKDSCPIQKLVLCSGHLCRSEITFNLSLCGRFVSNVSFTGSVGRHWCPAEAQLLAPGVCCPAVTCCWPARSSRRQTRCFRCHRTSRSSPGHWKHNGTCQNYSCHLDKRVLTKYTLWFWTLLPWLKFVCNVWVDLLRSGAVFGINAVVDSRENGQQEHLYHHDQVLNPFKSTRSSVAFRVESCEDIMIETDLCSHSLETEAVTSSGHSQLIAPAMAKRFKIDFWKFVMNRTNCKHLQKRDCMFADLSRFFNVLLFYKNKHWSAWTNNFPSPKFSFDADVVERLRGHSVQNLICPHGDHGWYGRRPGQKSSLRAVLPANRHRQVGLLQWTVGMLTSAQCSANTNTDSLRSLVCCCDEMNSNVHHMQWSFALIMYSQPNSILCCPEAVRERCIGQWV